jgi:hypothetical protein
MGQALVERWRSAECMTPMPLSAVMPCA